MVTDARAAEEGAFNAERYLASAKALVHSLEAGNEVEAKHLLDELVKAQRGDLYNEIGRLTRELHQALNGFQLDHSFVAIAEKDIPDAEERLNYVIRMTDEAAHTTINALDACMPACQDLQEQAAFLQAQWTKFKQRQLSLEQFRELSGEIQLFFVHTSQQIGMLETKLNEVLMAQGFQDLTGQVIRRVIELVQRVEKHMVGILRVSREGVADAIPRQTTVKTAAGSIEAEGPKVPGVDDLANSVSGQDEVDDLLSSLGF